MKKFNYTINGIKYRVEINSIEGNVAEVTVNGSTYKVELDKEQEVKQMPKPTPVSRPTTTATPKPAAAPAPAAAAPAAGGSGAPVVSPLPGVIIGVHCKVGDEVKRGQRILVLEAMKMENDIKADRDGTITSIAVSQGDNVQEGATLVTIG
ncbi:biotin/lipoyl-containing protein [Porphyromonas cangingivalis]|uniref:Biotin-requiring enzyme n=1 Tax=Porphyromonas cangingivalis TaxID=36874 RepID=A0A1T4LWJ8_PORCN|nr:acetyl-CoA carboxylase biotin carboxyl carrier protein subunit [Porphyromonas cangingivalis]SJZ59027.1 Biotin-requiring enzyme [Porphyromonas cangingivalis]SPY34357.1 Glutaconyl-CoA decarboxylase subunit gamma [Porphyromonas cangingivalis]VEJ01937.1 Glutaconyl-CoA decarboxylase subunit gamma [Porphyromonas cangingivalis]